MTYTACSSSRIGLEPNSGAAVVVDCDLCSHAGGCKKADDAEEMHYRLQV